MMKFILVESIDALKELVPREDTIVTVHNEGSYRMNEHGEWEKIEIYNE